MLEKSKPSLRNFMGEGVYDGFSIAKATSEHANILQHNLRDSDVRECIIHGASPFRALMSGVREKGENYTCIIDGQPICMFGVNPIMEMMIGRIWLLGSYEIEKRGRKFIRWSQSVVNYYQEQYYQLENVVPADHKDTIDWLQFLGFELMTPPIKLNSFKVFRFVRCKGDKILINKEEQPIQC